MFLFRLTDCQWAAYYYTSRKSYYPVLKSNIKLSDIPKLEPLPAVPMCDQKVALREWAQAFGKTLKQCNVRQETCSCKAGTLHVYAYEKPEETFEPLDLNMPNQDDDNNDEYTEYD